MNDYKRNKIDKFINDELMSESVFEVLQKSFMKKDSNKDINYLASKMIAINLLEESWKDLERYKAKKVVSSNEVKQVGL